MRPSARSAARLSCSNGRRVTSDVDGTFAFDDLAAGDYALSAAHGELYGEASVALDATSDPVHIVIGLAPTLVVHVVDPSGLPLAGVHVDSMARAAISDCAGIARLRGIELFDVIHVTAPGRAAVKLDVQSEDPSETIERTVTLGSGAAVGGVVLDPSGAPVADARVEVSLAGRSGIASATTDDCGRWRIEDLGAGKHVVTASSARFVAAKDQVFEHDGVRPREDSDGPRRARRRARGVGRRRDARAGPGRHRHVRRQHRGRRRSRSRDAERARRRLVQRVGVDPDRRVARGRRRDHARRAGVGRARRVAREPRRRRRRRVRHAGRGRLRARDLADDMRVQGRHHRRARRVRFRWDRARQLRAHGAARPARRVAAGDRRGRGSPHPPGHPERRRDHGARRLRWQADPVLRRGDDAGSRRNGLRRADAGARRGRPLRDARAGTGHVGRRHRRAGLRAPRDRRHPCRGRGDRRPRRHRARSRTRAARSRGRSRRPADRGRRRHGVIARRGRQRVAERGVVRPGQRAQRSQRRVRALRAARGDRRQAHPRNARRRRRRLGRARAHR